MQRELASIYKNQRHLSRTLCRGTRFVLRKKPAGTIISPVAHQVDREYRVLKALSSVKGFPVPKTYVLCMDSSVIGTPFYVSAFSSKNISALF